MSRFKKTLFTMPDGTPASLRIGYALNTATTKGRVAVVRVVSVRGPWPGVQLLRTEIPVSVGETHKSVYNRACEAAQSLIRAFEVLDK